VKIDAAAATERTAATRELMKLTWDYPVHVTTDEPRSDATTVKVKRSALSRDEAIHAIAGKDPRPLLVVRECPVCNKTDDALLTKGADNERTLIYSRWFHCVKLPVDVADADHPFHALFPDEDSEHLFVSAVDGSGKIPLESDTSRPELWASMDQVLAAAYVQSPADALKGIQKHIDKIDQLHQKIAQLQDKRVDLMEKPHSDAAKVKAVEAEIDETKAGIAAERTAIEELSRLDLKPAGMASAPAKAKR
jgi:hypothetical protein